MGKMLDGIKVIDLSRNLAAPFCTMMLADLGAEVIKVEMPGKGDDARTYGPILKGGRSGYFLSVNRGKKSVTLNLKDKDDLATLGELIKEADVLMDNFRPGVLDKLGITEEWVYGLNPNIIFSSITGFGQTGPYRSKAAYDMVVQGYGGVMSITGDETTGPVRVGISLGDLAAGLYATIGIIGSLYGRVASGKGDRIDISMLDCQVALLENSLIRYSVTGQVPKGIGNRHASITPFEAFPTADGNIIICVGNPKNWIDMCNAMGLENLIDDERFSDNDRRGENHDELCEILKDVLSGKSTGEWMEILEEAGVPCGPINTVADIINDEQVLARNMIVTTEYPESGTVKSPGNPIKSSSYEIDATRIAPDLGANNEEIFGTK